MTNHCGLPLALFLSCLLLSGCGGGSHEQDSGDKATEAAPPATRFGNPRGVSAAPTESAFAPMPPMQPLQPGQPPQKPERSISTVPAVMGGQPGTNPLRFNQPFRLADEEYQFMAAKGKDYVGLESNPAMQPSQGNTFFLVRYQVINHGAGTVTVPNAAAVHLFNTVTKQVTDIDSAATNANVQSGAATGMPNQLVLEPERPQIQTLAFQLPNTSNVGELVVLVTEPSDPQRVFQLVSLSN